MGGLGDLVVVVSKTPDATAAALIRKLERRIISLDRQVSNVAAAVIDLLVRVRALEGPTHPLEGPRRGRDAIVRPGAPAKLE